MRIMGIDPGLNITGYGIISATKNKYEYIISGCICSIKAKKQDYRLLNIFDKISELIKIYQPEEVAIEEIFLHKNFASALKLGQARGAAIVALGSNINIAEYSARQIKQAVVGYGNAEKVQIKNMVNILLKINKNFIKLDESDALALAICHANHITNLYK